MSPMGLSGRPDPKDAVLLSAQDRFVAAWGQMGAAWGISRTMAEVHALLYITDEPMCTDDVMDRLQISRGNASMSMRALLEWGVVVRTHKRGDRKEYFRADQDVWSMVRSIVRERMKREIDPVRASLYEIRDLTEIPRDSKRRAKTRQPGPAAAGAAEPTASGERAAAARRISEHNKRLDAMIDLLETVDRLTQRFITPPGPGLRLAASLLGASAGAKRSRRAGRSDPPAHNAGAESDPDGPADVKEIGA